MTYLCCQLVATFFVGILMVFVIGLSQISYFFSFDKSLTAVQFHLIIIFFKSDKWYPTFANIIVCFGTGLCFISVMSFAFCQTQVGIRVLRVPTIPNNVVYNRIIKVYIRVLCLIDIQIHSCPCVFRRLPAMQMHVFENIVKGRKQ